MGTMGRSGFRTECLLEGVRGITGVDISMGTWTGISIRGLDTGGSFLSITSTRIGTTITNGSEDVSGARSEDTIMTMIMTGTK